MQEQSAAPHANIANPCSFLILQGKRAGQPCGRRATKHDKNGKQLCVTHFRMSNVPGESPQTEKQAEKQSNLIYLPEVETKKEKAKRKKPKIEVPSDSSSEDEYEYVKVPKKKAKQKTTVKGIGGIDYDSLWTNNVLDGLHSIIGLK